MVNAEAGFRQDCQNQRSIKAQPAIAFGTNYGVKILKSLADLRGIRTFNASSRDQLRRALHGTAVSEDCKRQHQDCAGESAKKS
jgi:hypothetical protein